jgi:integrative and conjugative element protein (TIGR02256 family)
MFSFRYKVLEYEIHISDSAYHIIRRFIQDDSKKLESGGILIGQIKGNNIFIQKVTIPNQFDKSTRYTFVRNKEAAQIILDHEVVNNQNTFTYLGEWHTHPEAKPTPSSQDLKMIKEQYTLGILNLPFVILIIQGISDIYISIYMEKQFHIASRIKIEEEHKIK